MNNQLLKQADFETICRKGRPPYLIDFEPKEYIPRKMVAFISFLGWQYPEKQIDKIIERMKNRERVVLWVNDFLDLVILLRQAITGKIVIVSGNGYITELD